MSDMDNGDLGDKIDALHAELPGMIRAAIADHESEYYHMTTKDFQSLGKAPQDFVDDHDSIERGQEFIIGQMKVFAGQQTKMLENQEYMAVVVLGPESINYDGEVTRTGGLQSLVLDINKQGEVKTRLSPRDRVAVYVAAIGGAVAIVVAIISALAAIFT